MSDGRKLREYYLTRSLEGERLARREGQLELHRTKELLARLLPPEPIRIIDIGGGTGVYASWLAELGHEVHMVDVVSAHTETAAAIGTFTVTTADARALPDRDARYDFALFLGPMYHLPDAADRQIALREARRVVKPGAHLAIAVISRLAIPLDGFVKGWVHRERGIDGLRNAAHTGHDPDGVFGAIAYFHRPTEIREEIQAAGLHVEDLLGVEGPGWVAPDFDVLWNDPDGRSKMLEAARICESQPELVGLSAHVLAVARSPVH